MCPRQVRHPVTNEIEPITELLEMNTRSIKAAETLRDHDTEEFTRTRTVRMTRTEFDAKTETR